MTPNEALIDAAQDGDVPAIKQALHDGAEINTLKCGRTALSLAAERGHIDAVQMLLEAGANVDLLDDYDYSALHWATNEVRNGTIIRALLEAGADVDALTNAHSTALNIAVTYGDREMADMLLAAGADLTIKNGTDDPPAAFARYFGYTEFAEHLQAIADGAAPRPTPEEVGLDMGKRIAALEMLGKPLGKFTEAERKRVAQRETREAQRQAALRDPNEGI